MGNIQYLLLVYRMSPKKRVWFMVFNATFNTISVISWHIYWKRVQSSLSKEIAFSWTKRPLLPEFLIVSLKRGQLYYTVHKVCPYKSGINVAFYLHLEALYSFIKWSLCSILWKYFFRWHQFSWFLQNAFIRGFLSSWFQTLQVTNNWWKNYISLDLKFCGLSVLRNPRKLEPHWFHGI